MSDSWLNSQSPIVRAVSSVIVIGTWYIACGIADTINANLLVQGVSYVVVTLMTTLSGSVIGLICCALVSPSFIPRILSTRTPPKMILWAGLSNAIALASMYSAFELSTMSEAYAFKAVEPLFTCILSLLISKEHITINTWFSVTLICVGSFMLASGMHKPSLGKSVGLVHSPPFLAIFLVLLSNFMFAVRTVASKPLLDSGAYAPMNLFAHTGVVSSAILTPVAALVLLHRYINNVPAALEVISWYQPLAVGFTYYIYHGAGNTVLFTLSSVSYAIAKQMRVVSVMLWSCLYFHTTFTGSAISGTVIVVGSTAWYSVEKGKPHPQSPRSRSKAVTFMV